MLHLTELSLSLSQRLDPLRQALAAFGVPVAYPPQEAGKYSSAATGGMINLYLSKVSSSIPSLSGYDYRVAGLPKSLAEQELNYKVFVMISLSKLYSDVPVEKAVVEQCADLVCSLLVGYTPSDRATSIFFEDYSLSEPDVDKWEALLTFSFLARRSPAQDKPLTPQEIAVSLYNASNLPDALDAVLVKNLLTIPPSQ